MKALLFLAVFAASAIIVTVAFVTAAFIFWSMLTVQPGTATALGTLFLAAPAAGILAGLFTAARSQATCSPAARRRETGSADGNRDGCRRAVRVWRHARRRRPYLYGSIQRSGIRSRLAAGGAVCGRHSRRIASGCNHVCRDRPAVVDATPPSNDNVHYRNI